MQDIPQKVTKILTEKLGIAESEITINYKYDPHFIIHGSHLSKNLIRKD